MASFEEWKAAQDLAGGEALSCLAGAEVTRRPHTLWVKSVVFNLGVNLASGFLISAPFSSWVRFSNAFPGLPQVFTGGFPLNLPGVPRVFPAFLRFSPGVSQVFPPGVFFGGSFQGTRPRFPRFSKFFQVLPGFFQVFFGAFCLDVRTSTFCQLAVGQNQWYL